MSGSKRLGRRKARKMKQDNRPQGVPMSVPIIGQQQRQQQFAGFIAPQFLRLPNAVPHWVTRQVQTEKGLAVESTCFGGMTKLETMTAYVVAGGFTDDEGEPADPHLVVDYASRLLVACREREDAEAQAARAEREDQSDDQAD